MSAANTLSLNGPDVALRTPNVKDIVLAHGAYVWRLLRYLGVAARDLDDVFQDVFTTVHEKLDELQDDGLRPWLHAMCVLHAKNYRRRARHYREMLAEDVPQVPETVMSPPQEQDVELARRQKLLLTLLDRLDKDRRTIFVLHVIEDLPMDQVARIVGCPLSTAYFRFKRACVELERSLVSE